MADKVIQMQVRNEANTAWDNLNPRTKASAVLMNSGNSVEESVSTHLADTATGAHKAKNISIDDAQGLFNATHVEGALEELFTSVSDGKNLVATAITDKGVATSGSDTFAVMADNIGTIDSVELIPSDDIMYASANNLVLADWTSPMTKVKEIKMSASGIVRVKMLVNNSGNAQIYVNDIPTGILRTSIGGGPDPKIFLEDIPVKKNDLVQLYAQASSYGLYIIGFEIYCTATALTAAEIILD